MAIFRLYKKHLESSYTNIYIYIYIYIWVTYMVMEVGGGDKVGTSSRICQNSWDMWDAWSVHAVTKLCLGLL